MLVCSARETQAAAPCEPWAAKIVSIEGRVEVSRIGEPRWVPARLEQTFCPGDRVRIESRSRAAVLLANQTVLRLDEGTALTFTQVKPAEPSLLDLLKGAIHFLSRTPAQLRINTPFVAAGLEGTEFMLRVTEHETALWVFEGRVRFANAQGSLWLSGGEAAAAQAGRAPQRRVVVRPREAVQWALYYPPLIDYRLSSYPSGPGAQGTREALKFYRHDDLSSAFASLDKVPDAARGASYYTLRAGLLLNVGRVDEARADLDQALKLDPKNATAYALQSVILMVQNESERALYLARKAEELDPQSPIPKVALSYAYQAKFDLENALKNIERAIALAPTDALAYARLAELRLSRGDLDRAVHAAKTAVALDPDLARTQAVLGFAYLTKIDIDRAQATFQKAIALDPASPLSRLGLGLAKIREGALKEGTREMEIAASLDPNNSLVRSYLGKAYFEEKRGGLASAEFDIAKQLDPKDPTPWFYDAIHKQTTNRPVEALHDLQKAIELNDNRLVYRSKLLLDEDLAARSASLGRIYNDLGFQQLGLVEGWKSINTDPSNYSAHRLLADNYAALPRHEIARVSELLQSQLLQPLNITPVQPNLGESNLLIVEGGGPSSPSFNEFSPLFTRNRLALQASGVVGDNDTLGYEVTQSGVWDKLSYSVGQFHHETDGFRDNNDLSENIYTAFVQSSLSPALSLQTEYRRKEIEHGDLNFNFRLDDFDHNFRRDVRADTIRFGGHYSLTPRTDFIVSVTYQDEKEDQRFTLLDENTNETIGTTAFESKGYIAEGQHLFRATDWNLIIGGGYYDVDQAIDAPQIFGALESQVQHGTVHIYNHLRYPSDVIWTVGASLDFLDDEFIGEFNRINPKFGVIWNITPSTTLRAAAFRILKRSLFNDQTIEPTQVAGFNQFFDDNNATESKRYGIALEQKMPWDVYFGLEASKRDLELPSVVRSRKEDREEQLYRAYMYWTPVSSVSVSADYQLEKFDVQDPDSAAPSTVTHNAPVELRYFHPSGFFTQWRTTYVNQTVDFPTGRSGTDDFFLVDAAAGFRLPNRYGIFSLGVRNLFDQEFNYQDLGFRTFQRKNPEFIPETSFFAQLTLAF
ncbi:MAG: FecR domain-containing protein [Gammaproteobacteria bacterium]